MKRHQFLYLAVSALAASACSHWLSGRLMNPCLSGLSATPALSDLLQKIWQGIDASQVWDSHVHIIGVGDSDGSQFPS